MPSNTANLRIDIHTHIIPEKLPKLSERYGVTGKIIEIEHLEQGKARLVRDDGTFFRAVDQNCYSARERSRECQEQNIRWQVISPIPVMFYYWAPTALALESSRYLNDNIAETCHKFPQRFLGLGTIPLQDVDAALKELERFPSLGLVGLEIGSHVNGVNLYDRRFWPLYQKLQELDLCVFVHPWDMMGSDSMKDFFMPWLVGMPAETTRALCAFSLGGIFDAFPQLRVGFAHAGGSFLFSLGRIVQGYKTRPDLCATSCQKSPDQYLDQFYIDTLTHEPAALHYIMQKMGTEKIMLGSDYPFALGEHPIGQVLEGLLQLSAKDKENIHYRAALRFMGSKAQSKTGIFL